MEDPFGRCARTFQMGNFPALLRVIQPCRLRSGSPSFGMHRRRRFLPCFETSLVHFLVNITQLRRQIFFNRLVENDGPSTPSTSSFRKKKNLLTQNRALRNYRRLVYFVKGFRISNHTCIVMDGASVCRAFFFNFTLRATERRFERMISRIFFNTRVDLLRRGQGSSLNWRIR